MIKSDRAGLPRVELGGNELYVSCVDHIYCFDFWWEFLLFPSALLARLILVFAWCILPLMFDIELARLLEDPTFSVGMIRRFIGGAMDLAYLVQNFV